MTGFQLRATVSIIAIALTGSAASAEVTAQQVWDSWKAQMGSGVELTIGSESLDGGVLTVSDLAISFSDENGTGSVTIDSLTFAEQGDGTVLITQPDVIPVTVNSTDPVTGGETSMTMTMTQTDAAIIASGTPEAMNHALTASRLALEITDMVIDGEPGAGSVVIGFNDMAGGYTTTGTASPIGLTGNFTVASMDMFMDITADGEQVTASGKSEGMTAELTGTIAIGPDVTPANTFDMGSAFTGSYAFGATSVQVQAPDGNSADIAMASATTSFDFSADTLAFDTGLAGVTVNILDSTMPMPISATLDEFAVGLSAPAKPTDAPAPFGLLFAVRGLAVSEDIWSMIDPGQMFAHDPVTAVIDVTCMTPKRRPRWPCRAPPRAKSIRSTSPNCWFRQQVQKLGPPAG
jgi:hypothetical protein